MDAEPAQGMRLADQRYHHGNLRDALIGAALALEPQHGALGISLREVARRVGVTHAAAYHHFASKEALVLAVADEGYARMLAAIREPELPAPFAGRMAALFRVIAVGVEYVRFAVDHPSRFRFMYGTLRWRRPTGRRRLRPATPKCWPCSRGWWPRRSASS